MEQTFTQGPWVKHHPKNRIIEITTIDEILICDIDLRMADRITPTPSQAESNAKLIAIAPEMLKCLSELTNCITGMNNGSVMLLVPIELSHKIGEVIEKATK